MVVKFHVFCAGRVQGMGFRDFVKKEAVKLHIVGWVRNLDDGRIENLASGQHYGCQEASAAL